MRSRAAAKPNPPDTPIGFESVPPAPDAPVQAEMIDGTRGRYGPWHALLRRGRRHHHDGTVAFRSESGRARAARPMSPSMEKERRRSGNLCRAGRRGPGPPESSRRPLRPCGETWILALESGQPSMMLAWFSYRNDVVFGPRRAQPCRRWRQNRLKPPRTPRRS